MEENLEMSINVKPTKIISGLEPERTRYLLQLFTVVATTKCLAPAAKEEPLLNSEAKEDEDADESVDGVEASRESPPAEIEVKNETKEDGVERPASLSNTFEPASLSNTLERPATARGVEEAPAQPLLSNTSERPTTARVGGRPSVVKQMKDRPETTKGTSRNTMHSLSYSDSAETDELSTFEETKTGEFGTLNQNAHKVILPSQMSDYDLESLADAIQCISQSTAPLGKYIDGVEGDIETLLNERDHWITAQGKRQDASLRAKLSSLEGKMKNQVAEIKRLEESVRTNDEYLKKQGVVHSY